MAVRAAPLWEMSLEQFTRAKEAISHRARLHNLEVPKFDHPPAGDATRSIERRDDGWTVVRVRLEASPLSVVKDMVDGLERAQAHPLGKRLSEELFDYGVRACGIIACRRGR